MHINQIYLMICYKSMVQVSVTNHVIGGTKIWSCIMHDIKYLTQSIQQNETFLCLYNLTNITVGIPTLFVVQNGRGLSQTMIWEATSIHCARNAATCIADSYTIVLQQLQYIVVILLLDSHGWIWEVCPIDGRMGR